MTTTSTRAIIALHVVNPVTQAAAYVVGYLVGENDDRIYITQFIYAANGAAYGELAIEKSYIKRRYSLPVTWW